MDRIELISDLTCPECNNTSSEKMPTDCCLYYYRCKRCNTLLKPKEGVYSLNDHYQILTSVNIKTIPMLEYSS
ncbi:MAG: GDCCVxC domain-containing (seleno)protein [Gammaproteobacteria bacterium]|nr:GDCCVxC domain-containing (seleno)protein [Gammaproteobacteria bacterium]